MGWSETDIANYQTYCKTKLSTFTEAIDCADLALVCLIDFAYANALRVRLKYYAKGWQWYDSKDYESVDKFRAHITMQLGALNVIDNTKPMAIQDASTGDLLMTKWHASLGHTRVISEVRSITEANGDIDYEVTWYQGNLPAVVPEKKTMNWSVLKDDAAQNIFDKKPRRWNFAQFE